MGPEGEAQAVPAGGGPSPAAAPPSQGGSGTRPTGM